MTEKSREELERIGREIEREAETRALEVVGTLANIVPVIGGPVASIMGGMAQQRKLERVKDVLTTLAEQLDGLEERVERDYVRTDEFSELLERTLRQAAEEREEEIRELYASFLKRAMTERAEPFDDQMAVLRVLERLRPPHVAVLRALTEQPGEAAFQRTVGNPGDTLRRRTGLDIDTVRNVVAELNDLRVTNITTMHVTMSGLGSENLQHSITRLGRRVLDYIDSDS